MDVREKPSLTHWDVVALNFIHPDVRYYFRRHYRMGLRSHVMEVLRPRDVKTEAKGEVKGGIRYFHRARPVRMLRIFRAKFNSLEEAEEELKRVKIVQKYLLPDFVAASEEFLVDYRIQDTFEVLLCGLQTYVEGEILDPWTPSHLHPVKALFKRMIPEGKSRIFTINTLIENAYNNIINFVGRIKNMIQETQLIPDLAGVGNLLLTPGAGVVLVDINNISRLNFEPGIPVDDRGYPVCDKSVQALYLLEKKCPHSHVSENDPLYNYFLNPARMEAVRGLERRFHDANLANSSYKPDVDLRAF